MNKPFSNKLLIIFCLVFFFCKVENARSEAVIPDTTESQELYLKSLFLSGNLEADDSSKLGILAKKSFYVNFKSRIKKHWELYNKEIGEPFINWKKKNVPEPKSKVVLYPFSGPDFPNAYTLFPKAHTFILIGLEAGGFNPEIETLAEAKIANGLNVLNASLDTISSRNYFMTNSMKIDISKLVYDFTHFIVM